MGCAARIAVAVVALVLASHSYAQAATLEIPPPSFATSAAAVRPADRADAPCLRAHRPDGAFPATGAFNHGVLPPSSSLTFALPHEEGGSCSPAALASLTPAELADAVTQSTTACLDTLWTFSDDVAAVVSEANVLAAAAAVPGELGDFAANANRLHRLAYFFHIAFFHEWYEPSLSYSSDTLGAVQDALAAYTDEPGFYLESPDLTLLRSEWIIAIDNVNGTHLALDAVQWILDRFLADPNLESDYYEQFTVFHTFFSIARQVGNRASEGAASVWWGVVGEDFLATMAAYALNTAYNGNTGAIVENAMYALSKFAWLDDAAKTSAHAILSEAFRIFPHLSAPWLRAVLSLFDGFGGTLDDATVLELDDIRDEVEDLALPNSFVFDQGRVVFRTAIDEAAARDLYDAMQEVDSQYWRKTGYLDPVAGDVNESLTLVVYGSPQDYWTYQPFLFGLPTNNGGIYIEVQSTFYTYDRTPEQSIYTLEELLRHEYVHYLSSRYLVHGDWGAAGSLYDGGRLVWFEEGLAEYIAGATRTHGVLPRATLVALVEGDEHRYSIADIVAASYGNGFTFYRYAGLFFAFLASERPSMLADVFAVARADDAGEVDALWQSFSADTALAEAYTAYLDTRVAEIASNGGHFAEDHPTEHTPSGLEADNATMLRDLLAAELAWPNGAFRVTGDRFRYSAKLVVPQTDVSSAQAELDTVADGALAGLDAGTKNFANAVCWFGNYEFFAGGARATIVVEGPYRATSNDVTAPESPRNLVAAGGPGLVELLWSGGGEADFAGYNLYRSEQAGGPYVAVNTVPLSTSHFIDTEVVGGTTYYYVATALDAVANESAPSNEVDGSSNVNVLVVNGYFDDGNTSELYAWAAAIEGNGIGVDLWDPYLDGEPTEDLLSGYVGGVVIWAMGYAHSEAAGQFSAARQALLTDYLDAGGSLVLSGAYVANVYGSTALVSDYLHVTPLTNDAPGDGLAGEPGTRIGDALSLDFTSSYYKSEISIEAPGVTELVYAESGSPLGGSAVASVDASYNGVFLAFPLDVLSISSRAVIAGRILAWLAPTALAGDANFDGNVTAVDALATLTAAVGLRECALCVCDVDDSAAITAADALAILRYVVGIPSLLATPGCEV